jgi:hypothetical protein
MGLDNWVQAQSRFDLFLCVADDWRVGFAARCLRQIREAQSVGKILSGRYRFPSS